MSDGADSDRTAEPALPYDPIIASITTKDVRFPVRLGPSPPLQWSRPDNLHEPHGLTNGQAAPRPPSHTRPRSTRRAPTP